MSILAYRNALANAGLRHSHPHEYREKLDLRLEAKTNATPTTCRHNRLLTPRQHNFDKLIPKELIELHNQPTASKRIHIAEKMRAAKKQSMSCSQDLRTYL